jgi:hypothetical protein
MNAMNNDDDVLTLVKTGLAPVRMSTTPEAVMSRGRSLRRRKHLARLAGGGALALALGAGVAVPALTAGPSGASQQATLAAWTVSRQADGSVTVSIRQLRDLPALRSRLAAEGARVTISDTTLALPLGCVAPKSAAQMPKNLVSVARPGGVYELTIRPALIPEQQMLRIALIPRPTGSTPPATRAANGTTIIHGGPVVGQTATSLFFTLVRDTAECTQ